MLRLVDSELCFAVVDTQYNEFVGCEELKSSSLVIVYLCHDDRVLVSRFGYGVLKCMGSRICI